MHHTGFIKKKVSLTGMISRPVDFDLPLSPHDIHKMVVINHARAINTVGLALNNIHIIDARIDFVQRQQLVEYRIHHDAPSVRKVLIFVLIIQRKYFIYVLI